MSCYESRFVACPFYYTSAPKRILCEGVSEGNNIGLTFASDARKRKYFEEYCFKVKGCQRCKLYEVLNQKYSD